MNNSNRSKVAFVNTEDRETGVASSIRVLNINPVKNKNVLIKPNFNTADQTPGSTHNDTLVALVEEAWKMGAKSVSLGERSYSENRPVMEEKGIIPLMEKLDVRIMNFDELGEKDWVKVDAESSHWQDGFRIARPSRRCWWPTGSGGSTGRWRSTAGTSARSTRSRRRLSPSAGVRSWSLSMTRIDRFAGLSTLTVASAPTFMSSSPSPVVQFAAILRCRHAADEVFDEILRRQRRCRTRGHLRGRYRRSVTAAQGRLDRPGHPPRRGRDETG